MATQKFKGWIRKFLPAEIVGTITAVGAAGITHLFSDNGIFIAYMGSLGEAIGFYATIIIQQIITYHKTHLTDKKPFSTREFSKIIANMILEFGPAGVIDGLLLRPFFMYIFPLLLTNFTLGIFIGKIVGDLAFYILVILSVETKTQLKKRNRDARRS